MRSTTLAALLSVVLLTACTSIGPRERITIGKASFEVGQLDGFPIAFLTKPDRDNPNVYVDEDGLLTVDQEPVRQKNTSAADHLIVWRLPNTTEYKKYIFASDDAVKLTGGDSPPVGGFQCRVLGPAKKVIACAYTRSMAKKWKYEILVRDTDANKLITLDPWIHQQ